MARYKNSAPKRKKSNKRALSLPLNQEVYLVTGAASGIGRRLALTFARRGVHVIMTDVDGKGLAETAATAKQKSYSFDQAKLDIRIEKDWNRLIDEIYEKYGRLDILLNVAGFIKPGYCHESSGEDVHKHFDINAKGLIFGTQAAARRMVEAGRGHIINFASLAGVAGIPGISLYSASKHAVRGYSLAVAQELKPHGVDVTVVCPDAVQTPMLDLQVSHAEAALTFSGDRFLTVEDIEKVILEKVLPKRPPEVLIPGYRGILTKLGAAFPSIAAMLADSLSKKGRKRQAAIMAGEKP
ncbi:MAG: SDR family oxidoreductase [Leptospirales bacterium]|jgi:3-oxoacyl-[acyl-carrier protein] reductase